MRKLDGSPIDSSCGASPLTSSSSSIPSSVKHEATFLGFDRARNQNVTQVPREEWAHAIAELTGKPSGTKLSCHIRGDLIRYENGMTLPCSFKIISGVVYRISESNLTMHRRNYPLPPSEAPLTDAQWDFAERELDKKESHSKLHHRQKFLKTVIDPETGREFQLTHDFISVEGKIYALSGRGWQINGGTAKVKIAVDEASNLWAIKLPHKWTLSNPFYAQPLKSEIAISQHVDFLAAFAERKITEQPLRNPQPVLVLPYFKTDLHDFFYISRNNVRETPEPERPEAIHAFEYQMLSILLQIIDALRALHAKKKVIHADIKLDNILLNYDEDTHEVTKLCIGDFGFSLRMNEFGHQEGIPRNNAENVPPEAQRDDVATVTFSTKSDVYSLGSIIKLIGEEIALFKGSIIENETSIFGTLAKRMMDQSPSKRPNLEIVSSEIIDYLDKHFVETDRQKLLSLHGLPVRDTRDITPNFVEQRYQGALPTALTPGYRHYCARWEGAGLFRAPKIRPEYQTNLPVSVAKL